MAYFLPPELVRQVNKLEWPKSFLIFSKSVIRYRLHLLRHDSLTLPMLRLFLSNAQGRNDF